MTREEAINYGKMLARRIIELYDHQINGGDDTLACMFMYSRDGEKINGKDPFEEILDGYAEYIFPDEKLFPADEGEGESA